MDNNIYIYKPIKGKLVYSKQISQIVSAKTQFTFDGINAKGNCLIVISNAYTSTNPSITADEFALSDYMAGDKQITNNQMLFNTDTVGTAYGYFSTNIAFADLTGVNTISYYTNRASEQIMQIYEL